MTLSRVPRPALPYLRAADAVNAAWLKCVQGSGLSIVRCPTKMQVARLIQDAILGGNTQKEPK